MTVQTMWSIPLLIVVKLCFGSKIDFTTTPNNIIEGVTQTFTVSCSLKDTVSNKTIKNGSDFIATSENLEIVTSIIIRKVQGDSQKDIARIVTGHDAVAGPDFPIGKLGGNMTQGQQDNRKYLTVTWNLPGQNLSGQYTCEINAANLEGDYLKFLSHTTTTSAAATVQELIALVAQTRQDMLVANEILLEQVRQEINNRPVVHYEDGTVPCVGAYTWDFLPNNYAYRAMYADVKFTKAYHTVPQINLSFQEVMARSQGNTDLDYWASIKSITTEGFRVECGSLSGSHLSALYIRWTTNGI